MELYESQKSMAEHNDRPEVLAFVTKVGGRVWGLVPDLLRMLGVQRGTLSWMACTTRDRGSVPCGAGGDAHPTTAGVQGSSPHPVHNNIQGPAGVSYGEACKPGRHAMVAR